MRSITCFAAVCLLAAPAFALKITNLDKVPHTVELAGGGSVARYTIAPNATETVTGGSQGMLSLVSTKQPKKSRSTVNADGLLSGVVGEGRNQGIPVDPNDTYVIWPGADLRLQSHRKESSYR